MASLEDLLEGLETPRASLTDYETRLREEIRDDVRRSVALYQELVSAIIRSNPRKDLDEILSRQDVQRTLAQTMAALRRDSVQRIRDAWNYGQDLAVVHINEEFDALEAGIRERVRRGESGFLENLVDDVNTNVDRLTNQLLQRVEEVFNDVPQPKSYVEQEGGAINVPKAQAVERATRLRRELALTGARVAGRVQAGGVVASSRGFTDRQLEAYQRLAAQDPSVRKVWVANFVLNEPCDMCHALHGTELPVGQSFDPYASFGRVSGIFRDLQGPPRHPNCRCRLVLLRQGVVQEGISVHGMRAFALNRRESVRS